MLERYLAKTVESDAMADGKMAFITGPRQVGKSTLAKALLIEAENYFLYDEENTRKVWARSPAQLVEHASGRIVLDEFHKDRRWKSKLKGIYDAHGDQLEIIATGSARFDFFRRGSDSLLGRYIPYRLLPFSVAETADPKGPHEIFSSRTKSFDWNDLLSLGGFPEPTLGGSEAKARRWSRLRLDRLVSEDSRDFRAISDINAFRLLADLLPDKVGSLMSINSLRLDVDKAFGTVKSWLQILDALYFCFTIKPYAGKSRRALKAEPKVYLYDILRIPAEHKARRLENLTALHLLKCCQYWSDSAQGEFEVRFVRNKDKREVDFLLLRDNKPWMLVECKSGDLVPNNNLLFYAEQLRPKYCIQLVQKKDYDKNYEKHGVRIMDYETFCSYLI